MRKQPMDISVVSSRVKSARLPVMMVAVALITSILTVVPTAAHASAGEHRISGTGCHTELPPYGGWYWTYASADCLTIDASTSGSSPGHAILEHGVFSGWIGWAEATVVTLDCLVVETTRWGHEIYASGTSQLGSTYSLTVTEGGFSAGTPTGSGPCNAHEWILDTQTGGFDVTHDHLEENEFPSAEFTYSCVRLTCTFDASPSFDPDGSIASYRWNIRWGDAKLSGQQISYRFPYVGEHTVNLTVVDDKGGKEWVTKTISVGEAPTAAFSFSCQKLTCDFDASQSSDPDGNIVEYEWYFRDTYSNFVTTSPTISHTFKSADSYYVYLYVKDDDGAWDSFTALVDLRVPFELSTKAIRQGNRTRVDLKWTGAMTEDVDIYRDGVKIATIADSGSYSDTLSTRSGSFTYHVCDSHTTRCSNPSVAQL